MIEIALRFILEEINVYLKMQGKEAVMSSYVDHAGSITSDTNGKLCITLLTIEQETSVRNMVETKRIANEYAQLKPAIRLNLSVLFGASADNYDEALKVLSYTIAFFQSKNVFTAQNSPTLDAGFDKLVLEMESTNLQDWNNIWGMLGGKHIPAVVYKVKMLTIQEGLKTGTTPPILAINQNPA
ncbi:DUF4255 domain-containing protein [Spirosoma flavum]|uniref:DUF4255 domain-containing protein n=1 Tax=Spirosoma flavum TaxID=2048557 RepID=A0ABW6AHE5_9BACT